MSTLTHLLLNVLSVCTACADTKHINRAIVLAKEYRNLRSSESPSSMACDCRTLPSAHAFPVLNSSTDSSLFLTTERILPNHSLLCTYHAVSLQISSQIKFGKTPTYVSAFLGLLSTSTSLLQWNEQHLNLSTKLKNGGPRQPPELQLCKLQCSFHGYIHNFFQARPYSRLAYRSSAYRTTVCIQYDLVV